MNLDAIKTRLADTCARSDIECACERDLIDDIWWYDTDNPWQDTTQEELREAVAYLETCGLVERHPENPSWVRFIEPDEPPPATVGEDIDARRLFEIAREHGLHCYLYADEQHPICVLGADASIAALRRLIKHIDEAAA